MPVYAIISADGTATGGRLLKENDNPKDVFSMFPPKTLQISPDKIGVIFSKGRMQKMGVIKL